MLKGNAILIPISLSSYDHWSAWIERQLVQHVWPMRTHGRLFRAHQSSRQPPVTLGPTRACATAETRGKEAQARSFETFQAVPYNTGVAHSDTTQRITRVTERHNTITKRQCGDAEGCDLSNKPYVANIVVSDARYR
ncbi:unnamed protein product [Ectocarpus sp. 13 AM-2016]